MPVDWFARWIASRALKAVPTVHSATLTVGSDGTATFTFPSKFKSLPRVTATALDAGRPISISIISKSNSSVKIKAYRSQLLPATIATVTALANYDVFGGSAIGSTIDVIATDQA